MVIIINKIHFNVNNITIEKINTKVMVTETYKNFHITQEGLEHLKLTISLNRIIKKWTYDNGGYTTFNIMVDTTKFLKIRNIVIEEKKRKSEKDISHNIHKLSKW